MQSYRQPFLGDPLGVFNIRSVAKLQKIEERTLPGKIVAEKSRIPEKTERGPFGLVRYCMLRGKPFWLNSLGQRVQFGVFLKFVELLE